MIKEVENPMVVDDCWPEVDAQKLEDGRLTPQNLQSRIAAIFFWQIINMCIA